MDSNNSNQPLPQDGVGLDNQNAVQSEQSVQAESTQTGLAQNESPVQVESQAEPVQQVEPAQQAGLAQAPEASEASEAPETPKVLETPEVPEAPEASETPDMPDLDQLSEEEMLELFVIGLMNDKGMDTLDEPVQKEIAQDLKEQAIYRINQAIIAALPDDKFNELNKKLDEGAINDEVMNKIVTESGIDVTKIVEETLLDFRKVYLGEDEANKSGDGAVATEG